MLIYIYNYNLGGYQINSADLLLFAELYLKISNYFGSIDYKFVESMIKIIRVLKINEITMKD